MSNLFVTLPSKNKLPEDIFFNQFNVNGALRARKNPFFFDFSVQRLAARFARGKNYFFFDLSAQRLAARFARGKIHHFLTFQKTSNQPSGPSNSDSPRNFLYFGGLRALYDPLSVYDEALLVFNRTLKRWTTIVCEWDCRVTKRLDSFMFF